MLEENKSAETGSMDTNAKTPADGVTAQPAATKTPIALPSPRTSPLPLKGQALGQHLVKPSDPLKITITYEMVDRFNRETMTTSKVLGMKVVFNGRWDGRLIRAAIRGIERSYNEIKHNALRESVTKRAQEAKGATK